MAPEPKNPYLPDDILRLYEVRNHRHAVEILANSCPQEFGEILNALRALRLTAAAMQRPGEHQSTIQP